LTAGYWGARRDRTVLRDARSSSIRLALADLAGGLRAWRVWTFLAQHEIRQRYRRSALGPLWLVLGLAINVLAISLIWGRLFDLEARQLVPYITLGLMVWNLLVGMLYEGCISFIASISYVTQTNRPLSTYAFQVLWRNYLIAAHSFVVYLGTAVVFQLAPTLDTLYVVPGLILFVVATSWAPLLLGITSARFRDIPMIVQSVLGVAMFLTPVLWRADQLGDRAYLATLNPFSHLIELIRAPLLGEPIAGHSWLIACGTALCGWLVTVGVFARSRRQIPYWL